MSSQLPSFLTPTRSELVEIHKVLKSREQARHILSKRSLSSTQRAPTTISNVQDDQEPYSIRVGSSKQNFGLNRYRDIIAYDSTRILIPLEEDSNNENPKFHYVNASLIVEPDLGFPNHLLQRQKWVTTQGPTMETVPSFLSLLTNAPTSPALQSSSSSSSSRSSLPLINLIVQLTPLSEGGREKCHPYYPPPSSDSEGEESWSFDSQTRRERFDGGKQGIKVTRLEKSLDHDDQEGERRRWLRIENIDRTRTVMHVEYLGWRDHGVPSSPCHLLKFIDRMNKLNESLHHQDSNANEPLPPILLHCSAGVGRTGTYLTIASLLPLLSLLKRQPTLKSNLLSSTRDHPLGVDYPFKDLIRRFNHHDDVNDEIDFVGLTVDRIRDQRTTMVQTREQLEFIYKALEIAWQEIE